MVKGEADDDDDDVAATPVATTVAAAAAVEPEPALAAVGERVTVSRSGGRYEVDEAPRESVTWPDQLE